MSAWPGDLLRRGSHRLICGDATDPTVIRRLVAFEPNKPDNRPRIRPKTLEGLERWMGLLFFLGPALAFIGAIYLLGLLGDLNTRA
jgi:hypothetical protein